MLFQVTTFNHNITASSRKYIHPRVFWLLSQVALGALKVLCLLSWVALAKVVISKLLRMEKE